MQDIATINAPAPQPEIECWAQGDEPSINELANHVILIEVIQVNCPGCFIHALPEAIRLHETYQSQGLKVFAIATAFEHFEYNTLNNLERLLQHGELYGDPLTQLNDANFLEDNKLPYTIPFSVAMDKLVENTETATQEAVEEFTLSQIPDFHNGKFSDERKQEIYQRARSHLNGKKFSALTFEMYQLQGTPSSILIDKKGILRNVAFGAVNQLQTDIERFLNE
jgi:hypothetical protein